VKKAGGKRSKSCLYSTPDDLAALNESSVGILNPCFLALVQPTAGIAAVLTEGSFPPASCYVYDTLPDVPPAFLDNYRVKRGNKS